MTIQKAMVIFNDITSQDYTDEEKLIAIYKVIKMPTHMSITKTATLKALIWLWNSAYEIKEGEQDV